VTTHGVPLAAFPAVLQVPSVGHVHPALFRGGLLILEDYQGGPPLAPVWWEPAARLGARAILALPLYTGEEYLGSLHLAGPQPRHFSPAEVAILERLARLGAQLLVHTRALKAAEFRAGALETMQAVARSLEATLDLDQILAILVTRSVDLVGATGGFLMLWDEGAHRLIMRQLANAQEFAAEQIARDEGVTGTAFATGLPQLQNSYQQFPTAIPSASQQRVTNVLAVPLLRQGRPFGTITVFSKVYKAFTPEDASLLVLFASQAAVALDNGVLYTTLVRQQRRQEAIIRALHDSLVVYDRDGRILLLNPAAEELLGLQPAVIGVAPADFARPASPYFRYAIEPLHDWPQTFAAVVAKGMTLAGMTRILSEPVRTVETFYSPYLDETGGIAGVIALSRDVSATQELERLRAELEVANQHDDFLSIAAHELRTPITAIKGFGDLLARRLEPGYVATARDAQMLHNLSAQVLRLSALVNDLLDVGRLGGGEMELRLAACDLAEVVRAAVESVRPVAGPREADLQVTGTGGPVWCDRERLEQVFVNLLTNALKYSAAGPIICRLTQPAGQVCVAVSDQGAGIAAADLPHVFERFYRAHDVYAHQRGLGLGLYISREIVERHQGRIWVESVLGQGSTFHVELPLWTAPA
ncbi:MAG TPA: ATP-binding protein, partial [Chloroflexia bacterium]|nr:ATP-binding protein [Chloroflexia bacterium]